MKLWRRWRRRSIRHRLRRIEEHLGFKGAEGAFELIMLRPLSQEVQTLELKIDALALHLGVHFEYQDRPAIGIVQGPKPKLQNWEDY